MSVTIRFCGAARTVTGACYLVQTQSGRFLIECGLFQGQKTLKELNYHAFPFRPADGLIDQNASESWLDTCGWLISFQRLRGDVGFNRLLPVAYARKNV